MTSEHNARFDSIFRREKLQLAVRSGYLLLCGNSSSNMENNLKRRYFALFDHLYYYENEAAYLGREEPEGIIHLDVYYITKSYGKNPAGGSNNINDFTIFSYNPVIMTYTCRASNTDDLEAWFTTINGFSTMI